MNITKNQIPAGCHKQTLQKIVHSIPNLLLQTISITFWLLLSACFLHLQLKKHLIKFWRILWIRIQPHCNHQSWPLNCKFNHRQAPAPPAAAREWTQEPIQRWPLAIVNWRWLQVYNCKYTFANQIGPGHFDRENTIQVFIWIKNELEWVRHDTAHTFRRRDHLREREREREREWERDN